MDRIVIAIDGPAGAGKSTISKIVAKKLNIEYIDTGAMYRAVTLKLKRKNVSLSDEEELKKIMDETDIDFVNSRVYLDGEDVSEEIRMPYVSEMVSEVAAKGVVREKLVQLQRNMAAKKSVIMDGRDIGTNVLKDANYKIYLTASVEERAERRYKEMKEKGINVTFSEICHDIQERDRIDMSREINPLKKAEDAVLVDTTGKGIDDVVEEILKIANSRGR
jgi:cytidylate kinase